MQVRGLRAEMCDAIVAARKERRFKDLADLLARVPLQKPEAENLVRVGALDGLGPSRPALLWGVGLAYGKGEGSQRKVFETPSRAIASEPRGEAGRGSREVLNDLPDYDSKKRLALEMEILDLTVSAHPLGLHAEKVARVRGKRPTVRSIDLENHVGETVYAVGWRVTGKLTSARPSSALASLGTSGQETRELMEFVTFSDEWGRFEATFFPRAYQRLGLELDRGPGPFLIKGKVEQELGQPGIVATDVAIL
jgi:DNA polymerase III alpha subunit